MSSPKRFILALLCLLLIGIPISSQKSTSKLLIAVVKEKGLKEHDIAVEGFCEELNKEKISFQLENFDERDTKLIARLKLLKPDIILAVGIVAAERVTPEIQNIPIVFSMVMDPKGSGITAKNIYGASIDIPVRIQLETIKQVLPKLTRIGVIYNPPENENLIKEARAIAKELGLDLKTYPVQSEPDIPQLNKLPIDVLWIIVDSVVCTKSIILEQLLRTGLESGIAVMGYSQNYAKAGALIGISCDYRDIGRQSGEIALKVLKNEPPIELKNSVPRIVKFYLNRTAARELGIALPDAIYKKASEVY